jgi:hypothetical protein
VATALLCAAVLAIDLPLASHLLAARTQLKNRESTSAAVLTGRWLECRMPPSTRIAYDYFSYVPPAFRDASPTWGGSRPWLSDLNPDIVIVNDVTAGAVMGDAGHAAYYRCLASGSCGYGRVRSYGEITVYARSDQAGALATPVAVPAADAAGCEALLP